MNEEQKNIETCLAEDVLSEVANVPTDQQFRSLVEESFDQLKQQALRQAGYDGYKEVVMYHQPYTFTSQVKQMKSNLILLLRRLWRFPFGRGTTASSAAGSSAASAAGSSAASAAAPIRSLADMWQHYINRLKGNPEYGIPSRLSQLTDLPSAPALLADRDISSGIRFGTNPLPDGMSLAQLLCSTSAASSVTEIVDTNVGWEADKTGWLSRILNLFPNITKATFGCTSMTASPMNVNTSVAAEIHIKTKDLNFSQENVSNNMSNCDVWLDELETCNVRAQGAPTFRARRIFFPIFRHGTYSVGGSAGWQNKQTQYIYFGCYGKRTESIILTSGAPYAGGSTHSLAILEIRQGARQRIEFANIPSWDCYPNMTAANIVAYIFDKLADNNYEDDGITEAPAITIKLGSYLLAKLSAEQIAVATNKNYTVTA